MTIAVARRLRTLPGLPPAIGNGTTDPGSATEPCREGRIEPMTSFVLSLKAFGVGAVYRARPSSAGRTVTSRVRAARGGGRVHRNETKLRECCSADQAQLRHRVECSELARKHRVWSYIAGDGQLPQPIREAQGDLLESIDQHVVVEGAVKARFLGQRSLRALVEHERGGVPVHR